MVNICGVALSGALAVAIGAGGDPTVRITGIKPHNELLVSINLTNPLGEPLTLLSPDSPSVIVDRDKCAVTLSNRTSDMPETYDFTPRVVKLAAGETTSVVLRLDRDAVPTTACSSWHLRVIIAYLSDSDAKGLRLHSTQNSREYVIQREKVVTSDVAKF